MKTGVSCNNFFCIAIADPGTAKDNGTIFFTRNELDCIVDRKLMIDLKVWLEHGDDTKQQIGRVAYAWVDGDAGLMIVMEIFKSKLISRVVIEWVKNGTSCGVSLGYDSIMQRINGVPVVKKKVLKEVSIVKTPYHPTCKIIYINQGAGTPRGIHS